MDVSFPLSSLRSELWMNEERSLGFLDFFLLLKAGRFWCFYEPGGENTQIWSEFKFDLLSPSSGSVKRFSLSVWGGGRLNGGGRRQEAPWRAVSPDGRTDRTGSFTPGWSFGSLILSPRRSIGRVSVPAPNCQPPPCPFRLLIQKPDKLNLAFLHRFPFHLSCSSWRRRRCGVGVVASELMGLCRWQRS